MRILRHFVERRNHPRVNHAIDFHISDALRGGPMSVPASLIAACLMVADRVHGGLRRRAGHPRQRVRTRPPACRDAMRLCREAVPNVRNVLICFMQNQRQDQQSLQRRAGELRALDRCRALRSRRSPRAYAAGRSIAASAAANVAFGARRRRARGAITRMNFAFRSSSPNGRAGSPGTCVTLRSWRSDARHGDMRGPRPRIAGREQAPPRPAPGCAP